MTDHDAMVLVLIGPSGAGKTTLAARYPADTVLCLDTYRRMVSDDDSDQDATGDAVALLDLVLHARCRRELLSVVDATNTDAPARRHLAAVAGRHGLPAVALVLDTPLPECLARQATRPGPAPGARWGRAVPEHVVVAQHTALRAAIPSLAREGFTRVIPVSPDGLPTQPPIPMESTWRALWEPTTGTLAVVDPGGETLREAPVPAAGPHLRHLDDALRALGWAPTGGGWWHPPHLPDVAPDEYDRYIRPATPTPGPMPGARGETKGIRHV